MKIVLGMRSRTHYSNRVNKKMIQIKLGFQTREVEIERFTEKHCWHAKVSIVCKFPTGTKRHTIHGPQAIERNGRWEFPMQSFRNRNRAIPYSFAETLAGDSGWTQNENIQAGEKVSVIAGMNIENKKAAAEHAPEKTCKLCQ